MARDSWQSLDEKLFQPRRAVRRGHKWTEMGLICAQMTDVHISIISHTPRNHHLVPIPRAVCVAIDSINRHALARTLPCHGNGPLTSSVTVCLSVCLSVRARRHEVPSLSLAVPVVDMPLQFCQRTFL